jgi:hypothetical protein
MSYNCDTWKTKELVDLRIPVASLFKHSRTDWYPEREDNDDGSVCFRIMEGSQITGRIEGDWLLVSSIEAYGEGSGTALHWIIEPALADSKGKLVASRVWEGGDSIDCLIVEDGNVRSEAVEL